LFKYQIIDNLISSILWFTILTNILYNKLIKKSL